MWTGPASIGANVDGQQHPGHKGLSGAVQLGPTVDQELPATSEAVGWQQVPDPAVAVGRGSPQRLLLPAGQQKWDPIRYGLESNPGPTDLTGEQGSQLQQ